MRTLKDVLTIGAFIKMSVWEMDKDMVYYDNDRAYPGLTVMAKFFKDIKNKGSED